jgi:hypothetical protein
LCWKIAGRDTLGGTRESERSVALKQSQCANHPDRYGHAICMSCRKTLCQECATEWDGIFHCAGCLAKQRKSGASGGSKAAYVVVGLVCVILFLAGPKLLLWGATLLQRSVGN